MHSVRTGSVVVESNVTVSTGRTGAEIGVKGALDTTVGLAEARAGGADKSCVGGEDARFGVGALLRIRGEGNGDVGAVAMTDSREVCRKR